MAARNDHSISESGIGSGENRPRLPNTVLSSAGPSVFVSALKFPHTTVWALDSPHLHLHKTTY
jgi:hypothetical protein